MLIKTALLSLVFCTASCGQQLAVALSPETESKAATDAGAEKAADKPNIIFKSGDGTENAIGDDAPGAKVPGPIADWIIVDKSDRMLVLYKDGKEIKRYSNIRFGDAPKGHKRFQGDEKTPEGDYYIDGRNPGSSYHLSLRISYPNDKDRAYAKARGKSPGGDIFIHGQPNGYSGPAIGRDWTDGCIAVSNAEIREIWQMVPNGAQIRIQQ